MDGYLLAFCYRAQLRKPEELPPPVFHSAFKVMVGGAVHLPISLLGKLKFPLKVTHQH